MKKRTIVTSVVLSLAMLFGSCNVTFASQSKENVKIEIIHTNDTHGRIAAEEGFGFEKISTFAKEEKAKNPDTLLIDAGDTFNGNPVVNLHEGEDAIKILEKADYDFMTLGNNDFNYGYDRITELSKMISNPKIISSNVFKDGKREFAPYKIIDMDGVKVGLFGLTTPTTATKVSPAKLKGVEFRDPIEISKEMVNELKDKTDVIIAIAHIGEEEGPDINSRKIVESVDGIDVIIDGHSHTELPDGYVVNNTLIAQTGSNNKNLGKVEIDVKDNKVVNKTAKLLKAEDYSNVKSDKEVRKLIDSAETESKKVYSEVVGNITCDLDGERKDVRTKETNLGNLVADAAKDAGKAEIGLMNSGLIRESLKNGDLNKGDIAEVFSLGGTLQKVQITGENLLKALERSVHNYPEETSAFLQVSGITFSFNPSKEAGSRVADVKVNGEDLDLNRSYSAVINDFISAGLDGFTMLKTDEVENLGIYDDIFVKYLKANGTDNCNKLGRIKVDESVVSAPAAVIEQPAESVVTEVPQVQERVYVVQAGDNLYRIGVNNNVDWNSLAQYNNLSNPTLIYPGQVIRIPA